jgi:U3 small nucleolar RNA-associated protein 3
LSNIKGNKKNKYEESDDEVLAFEDSDDSENSDDYDDDGKKYDIEEDEENEDDIDDANLLADGQNENDLSYWGRKKSAYYSGNRIRNEEDALLEEEEANLLQAKMMKQLDTNDFGLDAFKLNNNLKIMKTGDELEANKLATTALGDDKEKNLEKIAKNLSKMSKKEKFEFLQQESPELFELVRDFKAKISELEAILLPIFGAIKQGQIVSSNASDFIVNKTRLYLMYCSHLSFYFSLKAQRLPVDNHPIVKNILQYRNLCKQISSIDDKLVSEIKVILDSLNNGKQLHFAKANSNLNNVKKSVKFRDQVMKNRQELRFDDDDENESEEEKKMEDVEEEEEGASKRPINYEIEKNKGLTPKRPKMYRNPRVRNRIKARKAVIKRKSIVQNIRPQDKRYSGEATGIRTNVVRAVKIK